MDHRLFRLGDRTHFTFRCSHQTDEEWARKRTGPEATDGAVTTRPHRPTLADGTPVDWEALEREAGLQRSAADATTFLASVITVPPGGHLRLPNGEVFHNSGMAPVQVCLTPAGGVAMTRREVGFVAVQARSGPSEFAALQEEATRAICAAYQLPPGRVETLEYVGVGPVEISASGWRVVDAPAEPIPEGCELREGWPDRGRVGATATEGFEGEEEAPAAPTNAEDLAARPFPTEQQVWAWSAHGPGRWQTLNSSSGMQVTHENRLSVDRAKPAAPRHSLLVDGAWTDPGPLPAARRAMRWRPKDLSGKVVPWRTMDQLVAQHQAEWDAIAAAREAADHMPQAEPPCRVWERELEVEPVGLAVARKAQILETLRGKALLAASRDHWRGVEPDPAADPRPTIERWEAQQEARAEQERRWREEARRPKVEPPPEPEPTRFSGLELDGAEDPQVTVLAWRAEQARRKAEREAARAKPRLAPAPEAEPPRSPAFTYEDASLVVSAQAQQWAVLGRLVNPRC